LADGSDFSVGTPAMAAGNVIIGAGIKGPSASIIDNVMIYDRALSADEIKFQYYNQNEADNELTWDSEESFSVPTYMRIK